MNNLSWFIYFAGVVDTLGGWASFFACFGGIVYLIFMIVINGAIGAERDANDLSEMRGVRRQISFIAVPILAICIPLGFFTPTRQTMILMAGSELGERAIKSETVQGVMSPGMDLVKLWIKGETDKLLKATEKK